MNDHYTKKSFDSCQFNPLTDGKILQAYPRITEAIQPEWTDDLYLDNIIRYTIMVYDPKSALVSGERDLNYRKSVAADLAGFDMNDEDLMTTIYNCSYPLVAEFTIKYLMRFAKSKEWAAIVAFEYKFWESIAKLMQPIKPGKDKEELDSVQKKAAISDEIDKDIKRLDSYYKTFFGEDDELEKKAKKRVTPELMAEKPK